VLPSTPTADPDAGLVHKAKNGDQEAAAELYRRYAPRGYNLALRMLGNPWDAADVLQEAFIKTLGALDSFKGDARFSTWFHRIVVNAVYDHLRRRRADPWEETDLDRLSGIGGGDLVGASKAVVEPVQDGLSPTLKEALLSLNEGFRLAVVLCDLLGFDYAEAADILGVQEGTIKSRIFRARAELASILRTQGYGATEPTSSPPTSDPPGSDPPGSGAVDTEALPDGRTPEGTTIEKAPSERADPHAAGRTAHD
jgi:RNA polymerase sigma factor (sigma-70 family)